MLGEHWARVGRFRVPWAFPSGKPKAAGRGLMRPHTLRRATAGWRSAVAIHQPLRSTRAEVVGLIGLGHSTLARCEGLGKSRACKPVSLER